MKRDFCKNVVKSFCISHIFSKFKLTDHQTPFDLGLDFYKLRRKNPFSYLFESQKQRIQGESPSQNDLLKEEISLKDAHTYSRYQAMNNVSFLGASGSMWSGNLLGNLFVHLMMPC